MKLIITAGDSCNVPIICSPRLNGCIVAPKLLTEMDAELGSYRIGFMFERIDVRSDGRRKLPRTLTPILAMVSSIIGSMSRKQSVNEKGRAQRRPRNPTNRNVMKKKYPTYKRLSACGIRSSMGKSR